MELLKLLNTSELFAQIAAFLIMLAIMRAFFWKRLLGIIDKRREAISSDLAKIDESKNALSRVKREYDKMIAEIDVEAKARIDKAVEAGRKLADEMQTKAEWDAEALLERAKANLKDEVAKSREDLKDQIVDLVMQTAEKVIQERLSEESDRRLVESFISGVEKK